MGSEQFSLCWDNFHKNMSSGMQSLLDNEDLVDVTLAIDGQYLKAHKMVLSVCSPYFRSLFNMNPCKHPIVFMKDVSYLVMNDLLTFMYQGEVQVNQENLATFIKTAEALQIKGLTGDNGGDEETEITETKPLKRALTSDDSKPKFLKRSLNSSSSSKKPKINNVPSSTPTHHASTPQPTLVPPAVPKISKDETPTTDAIVQFKMEPYESATDHEQSVQYDDSQVDDSYIDETGDDMPPDDDYSMMEGDDEPQAGTSGDAGDSQELIKEIHNVGLMKRSRSRYIHDGFVYHAKLIQGSVRYLGCAELKKNGCKARAILHEDQSMEKIRVTKPHSHPPDHNAEEKHHFVSHLKQIASKNLNAPLKKVYNNVKVLYPNAAEEITFKKIYSSLHRWRKAQNN